jgi:long-subunit fatty acid transport protein
MNSKKVVYIIIFILMPFVVYSQDASDAIGILDKELGFGARALGMGGAYTAVGEDYSAIYWNPAGLAQIKRVEITGSLSHLIFDNKVSYFGKSVSDQINDTKFNYVGWAYPFPVYRGSLVFAIGYNRIKDFGGSTFLEGFNSQVGDSVYQKENIFESGQINNWSLAGAIDLTENFSLGLTLNIITGSSEYNVNFRENDIYNIWKMNYFTSNRSITSEYGGYNLKVGGLFKGFNFLKFGGTITIPTAITVNEEWSIDEKIYNDDNTNSPVHDVGKTEYRVDIPFYFDFGASLNVFGLLLSGDVGLKDWSQVKFKTSDFLSENSVIRSNYTARLKFRAGSEYSIDVIGSKIRAGFIFDPDPLKGSKYKNHRKYLTFGTGFLIDKQLMIDVTYLYGWWFRKTSDDLATGKASENIQVHKVLFGISYRF